MKKEKISRWGFNTSTFILIFFSVIMLFSASCAKNDLLLRESETTTKNVTENCVLTQKLAAKIEEILEKSNKDSLGFNIVCNVPYPQALVLINGVEVFGDSLSRLDPQNILDVSILPDTTAYRLYGHRATNGVILIKLITDK